MKRVIVCAAIRNEQGTVVCGHRHFDSIMIAIVKALGPVPPFTKQGFVDNRGQYLTREEAWPVAMEAGQIVRRVGGDLPVLYSENLY